MGNLGFETTEDTIRQLLDAHRPGNKKGKGVQKGSDDEKDDEKGDEKDDKMDEEKPTPVEAMAKKEPEHLDDWIRQVRMGTFEDTGLCKGYFRLRICLDRHSLIIADLHSSTLHPWNTRPRPSSTPKITT